MRPSHPLGARAARVVAQSKVNLVLRVLAREASGFHQIETLFQRLELGDDIRVDVSGSSRTLACRGADTGPPERNLAWRAALAYADRTGWPRAFAIEIDKRVPVGGGLGGGSADAGAVLRCLNALAPAPLPPTGLLELAARLGSDVPFLTAELPLALAWGRGERMLALPVLPARPVRLAVFATGVSTADAYAWLAESRGLSPAPDPTLLSIGDFATWDAVAAVAHNDFEAVVIPRHPGVAAVLTRLRGGKGARGIALMSGSGATIFAIDELASARDEPNAEWFDTSAALRFVTTGTAAAVPPIDLVE